MLTRLITLPKQNDTALKLKGGLRPKLQERWDKGDIRVVEENTYLNK